MCIYILERTDQLQDQSRD